MYELKIHRGVICYDKEEDAKFEKELISSKLHEEFNKFWPKHSKTSKICTLMGCFWPKYMLQLRKYREVMFDGTQDW